MVCAPARRSAGRQSRQLLTRIRRRRAMVKTVTQDCKRGYGEMINLAWGRGVFMSCSAAVSPAVSLLTGRSFNGWKSPVACSSYVRESGVLFNVRSASQCGTAVRARPSIAGGHTVAKKSIVVSDFTAREISDEKLSVTISLRYGDGRK